MISYVKRYFLESICVAFIITAFSMPADSERQGRRDDSVDVQVFKLVDEYHREGIVPLSKARLLIPSEHFSKESLDMAFRWYSKKKNNPKEMLSVLVFTNIDCLQQHKEQERLGIGYIDGQMVPKLRHQRTNCTNRLYSAFYRREAQEVDSNISINEVYSYSPDLNNPEVIKTIVLKGRDPFARKKNEAVWEQSRYGLRAQISSYDLNGNIEPSGRYYTFSYYTSTGDLLSLLTTQVAEPISNLPSRMNWINDQICYVFIGEMYAVTRDGGHNWVKWDAENDLPNYQCCTRSSISHVKVESTGVGTMSINIGFGRALTLNTMDYGQHWE